MEAQFVGFSPLAYGTFNAPYSGGEGANSSLARHNLLKPLLGNLFMKQKQFISKVKHFLQSLRDSLKHKPPSKQEGASNRDISAI